MRPEGRSSVTIEVWPVFGDRAGESLAAIKSEGLSEDSVRELYGCAVGVADASFSVAD
jgi:glycine betaine/proline transport system ATP-binding protein